MQRVFVNDFRNDCAAKRIALQAESCLSITIRKPIFRNLLNIFNLNHLNESPALKFDQQFLLCILLFSLSFLFSVSGSPLSRPLTLRTPSHDVAILLFLAGKLHPCFISCLEPPSSTLLFLVPGWKSILLIPSHSSFSLSQAVSARSFSIPFSPLSLLPPFPFFSLRRLASLAREYVPPSWRTGRELRSAAMGMMPSHRDLLVAARLSITT